MTALKINYLFLAQFMLLGFLMSSCTSKFEPDDYSAHFGGEIINPNSNFVLFCKGDEILDTLYLDENNHFFKSFDSLTPGMYIYKHSPEFQYVYFEKNDSLNMRLNTRDFDHSILFSGRGSDKNNFLMYLNTKNIVDQNKSYDLYDLAVDPFLKKIDSAHAVRTSLYLRNKAKINWSSEFDTYAKAITDLHFYSQKEIYPIAHYIQTKEDIRSELPENYYDFRKRINFNNENFIYFSSFNKYLAILLSSEVEQTELEFDAVTHIDKNIEKLNIVNTLIQNKVVKNAVLDNIAFIYLLDDQNAINNELFLNRYFELSSDSSQHGAIQETQNNIAILNLKKQLPPVPLVDTNGASISIDSLIYSPTLIFFWSKTRLPHFDAAHRKALHLLNEHPNLHIFSICIDTDQDTWLEYIQGDSHERLTELRATQFTALKDAWIINKIQRAILLNSDGSIHNAFINLFDADLHSKISALSD